MRVGCAGFMAPETYREQPCDVAADAFAFGQVLRRLLWHARPPPFSARSRAAALALKWTLLPSAATYESVHCTVFVHPAWPEAHTRTLRACCERQPERRPPMARVAEEFGQRAVADRTGGA